MESKRLIFRLIEDADASFLLELMNSPKWHMHIGDRNIQNEKDALDYMHAKMHPQLDVKGFINYVMIDKESNLRIGTCSIHDRDGVDGIDIGYALLPQFEGQGFAREGARFMAQTVFAEYDQQIINAITTDENTGSCKLLESIGFQSESYIRIPGVKEQLKLYTLLPENLK